MSSSSQQYVVDVIVQALAIEPSFNVVKVWRNDSGDISRTTVYPYVVSMEYRSDTEDASAANQWTRARVEILCSAMVENDAGGNGLSNERAGLIAQQVKYCIENFDLSSLDDNQDLYYSTRIDAMLVDGHIGNFNMNDSRVQLGVAVTVYLRIF